MRKAPKNAGEKRVCFSRQWDAAARSAGITDAAMAELVAEFRRKVRGEWATGTPSWPTVQLNALPRVVKLTSEAGVNLPVLKMRDVCKVPRAFVERERRYAILAMKNKDAGRFAAEVEPRIKRHRDDLKPGDWYAGDVHHIDLLFRVGDRVVTPKAVAWVDLATNRAWLDIHILPKGEAIRTEHVVQSWVNMCSHRHWGACSRLYIDNGGEYNWADLINDLCKLKHSLDIRLGENPDAGKLGVQRARAYNPQAKHIEGFFAAFERMAIAQLDGAIGGERMRKKTTNHGREPTPFPGDEAQLRKALMTALAYYHVKPQSGHLKGKSPNDSFAGFVDAGWSATILDPHELAVAFSHKFIKPVRAGGRVRLDTTDYRANALLSHAGRKVIVRQPMFGDQRTLFVFDEYDVEFLCTATPENVYAFGTTAGSVEQGRRPALLQADLRGLEADADMAAGGEAAMEKVVDMFGEPERATPSGAVTQIHPEYSAAARTAKDAPAREADEADQKAAAQARRIKILELRVAASGR